MDLFREVALLTDNEAKACLNGVLNGLAIQKPEYRRLFANPEELQTLLNEAYSTVGSKISAGLDHLNASNHDTEQQFKAIRLVLVEGASVHDIAQRLEAYLMTRRTTLLDPVTSSLVLAGIVLLLSTHITFKYTNADGKRDVKFQIDKPSINAEILKKFFSLFTSAS
jgi:hypothetical protein